MGIQKAGSKPKIGLIQFPGSNCDMDCKEALQRHFGISVEFIWHHNTTLPEISGLILPGGFSYGDYLRSGGLAARARIMGAVKEFADKGGAVIGICNGFQVLTECGLLPGALLRNRTLRFICRQVYLKSETGQTVYHAHLKDGGPYRIPIAHGDGRYFISEDGLKELEDREQIVFRYVNEKGELSEGGNANGSVGHIAGIVSLSGRVMGLMPHPERATDKLMGGSDDGLLVWKAFLASFL